MPERTQLPPLSAFICSPDDNSKGWEGRLGWIVPGSRVGIGENRGALLCVGMLGWAGRRLWVYGRRVHLFGSRDVEKPLGDRRSRYTFICLIASNMRTLTGHFLAREPRAHRSTEYMEAPYTSSATRGGRKEGGREGPGGAVNPEGGGHAAQLTALHVWVIDDSEGKSMRVHDFAACPGHLLRGVKSALWVTLSTSGQADGSKIQHRRARIESGWGHQTADCKP